MSDATYLTWVAAAATGRESQNLPAPGPDSQKAERSAEIAEASPKKISNLPPTRPENESGKKRKRVRAFSPPPGRTGRARGDCPTVPSERLVSGLKTREVRARPTTESPRARRFSIDRLIFLNIPMDTFVHLPL
jgi:hypothetical protein